jgi:fumarylpyruvate hydrolase
MHNDRDMTSGWVLPPPERPSLPVQGTDARFPVRRIYCVGRNYAEHAREMGHDPDLEPPFFFQKPASALVTSGAVIPYPPATTDLHHEAELVVALKAGGANLTANQAMDCIFGYAAGNDLTRRDLQAQAKAARRPWDMSKGFDNSAVIGAVNPDWRSVAPVAAITAHVQGNLRQSARLSDMIWSVPDILSHLSRLVTLAPGDLVMTGTPAGVGPIGRGESCTVSIAGLPDASVTIL